MPPFLDFLLVFFLKTYNVVSVNSIELLTTEMDSLISRNIQVMRALWVIFLAEVNGKTRLVDRQICDEGVDQF